MGAFRGAVRGEATGGHTVVWGKPPHGGGTKAASPGQSCRLGSDRWTETVRARTLRLEQNSAAGRAAWGRPSILLSFRVLACKAGIRTFTQRNSQEALTASAPTDRDQVLSPDSLQRLRLPRSEPPETWGGKFVLIPGVRGPLTTSTLRGKRSF